MKFVRLQRNGILPLILFGMLLRVSVPQGFMPADLSSGWYLQLCPDGMPANVMMALLGHEHHHHHHDDRQASAFAQCDLGGIGVADAPLIAAYPAGLVPKVIERFGATTRSVAVADVFFLYRSRAPPVFS